MVKIELVFNNVAEALEAMQKLNGTAAPAATAAVPQEGAAPAPEAPRRGRPPKAAAPQAGATPDPRDNPRPVAPPVVVESFSNDLPESEPEMEPEDCTKEGVLEVMQKIFQRELNRASSKELAQAYIRKFLVKYAGVPRISEVPEDKLPALARAARDDLTGATTMVL